MRIGAGASGSTSSPDGAERGRRRPLEQHAVVALDDGAGAVAHRAQALHHRDQAVVAQHLELSDRAAGSLLVGLPDEAVEQLVGQLRNVHQLGPRPLQGRAELGHEVTHAGLTPGDAIGEERPHEAPAQPGAEADRVVDLLDRGDAIVHEPERLPPQRLEQPIGDEAVDLLRESQRVHPHALVHGAGAFARGGGRERATAHLDQRQQVHRIERMSDDEPLRMLHARLQQAREQARGGRREHDVGRRGSARPPQQVLLQLQPLGRALLHEVDALGRFFRRGDERESSLGRQRRHHELPRRPSRVVEHVADLARCIRIGIEQLHVDAVEQEPRRPAAADDTAAEQADALEAGDRAHRLILAWSTGAWLARPPVR